MVQEAMTSEQEHQNEGKSGRGSWRTFLMLAGSALLGGTAVALWNRRLLADIRRESQEDRVPTRDERVENDDAA
jgi:hypothetical protein